MMQVLSFLILQAYGATVAPLYFEQQEQLLCGKHAINNLLQSESFTKDALYEICHHQAKLAWDLHSPPNVISELCDLEGGSGNFNATILESALESVEGLKVERTHDRMSGVEEKILKSIEDERLIGFLIIADHHWWAIRKFGDVWVEMNKNATSQAVNIRAKELQKKLKAATMFYKVMDETPDRSYTTITLNAQAKEEIQSPKSKRAKNRAQNRDQADRKMVSRLIRAQDREQAKLEEHEQAKLEKASRKSRENADLKKALRQSREKFEELEQAEFEERVEEALRQSREGFEREQAKLEERERAKLEEASRNSREQADFEEALRQSERKFEEREQAEFEERVEEALRQSREAFKHEQAELEERERAEREQADLEERGLAKLEEASRKTLSGRRIQLVACLQYFSILLKKWIKRKH